MTMSCCQVFLREFLKLLHVLDMVCKLDLLCRCQQWNPSDAAEIEADGISSQTATLTR